MQIMAEHYTINNCVGVVTRSSRNTLEKLFGQLPKKAKLVRFKMIHNTRACAASAEFVTCVAGGWEVERGRWRDVSRDSRGILIIPEVPHRVA